MNIAYLCADFGIPIHGDKGAAIHVREVSRALVGLGHRVEIIAPRAGGPAPADFGVPVRELPLSPDDKRLFGLLRDDPAGGEPAAKEIRSMLYAAWLRHSSLPHLRAFGPDAIYERYALLATAGSALARELGVPHILEVNAPLSNEQATHRGSLFAQTARAVERTVLGSATRVISVSDPLRDWMVGLGVAPERITVVWNGVDVERFAAGGAGAAAVRLRHSLGDQPVIGFVGTLKAWHGTATLVRAFAMLDRVRDATGGPRLLIVGDGPERATLESLAWDEGVSRSVTFTGSVTHAEIPAHIAAMDIVTAPYDVVADHYFSPLKLFEYMASGRPIVAAEIGQIATCLRDGETGLLYRPGDVPSLAARMTELLDDPARGHAMGQVAQEVARARHGWDAIARTVIDLIGGAGHVGRRTVAAGPVVIGHAPSPPIPAGEIAR